ncbi:MAG: fumarylacetoacetase [Herpetosiphon sp.]
MSALRDGISQLLRGDRSEQNDDPTKASLLIPMIEAELSLPAIIGDYTDFYASIHHARRVGSIFRPSQPLLPNYQSVPIGYHGRASSVVVSGTTVRRPWGQQKQDASMQPLFAPTEALDYEVEVGILVRGANDLGMPVRFDDARRRIFGLCLLNDWSARDVQNWEARPLGPFLGKSFATSISPWVITMEALAPFGGPVAARSKDDPPLLAYLDDALDKEQGAFDLQLEVWIESARMREEGIPAMQLSRSRFADLYWTMQQLVVHHASNGCNLRTGDLLGSGTVSGPDINAGGCLLELGIGGPTVLPSGEQRVFLADDDVITLRGFCDRPPWRRIGFGICTGTILPAWSEIYGPATGHKPSVD